MPFVVEAVFIWKKKGSLIIWSRFCLCLSLLSPCSTDKINWFHWPFLLFLSALLCHYTAALWWPSWTAYRSVSRCCSRPVYPVVHHAPWHSEARPSSETCLPRRHRHPSSTWPTQPGWHRWTKERTHWIAAFYLFYRNTGLSNYK